MRRVPLSRPSPALVVSIVALLMAMGGTGYAALKLPKNSVGPSQIANNAVTSPKVKNGSLKAADFGAGQIPAGPRGAQGERGPAGTNGTNGTNGSDGAPGARGPSDAYVSGSVSPANDSSSASVTVPAGDYVASASGQAQYFRNDSNYPTSDSETHCQLTSAADGGHDVGTFATVPAHGYSDAPGSQRGGLAVVSQNTAFHLPNGGTITYTCANAPLATKDAGATQQYANMRVTAIQVGALH